MKRVLFAGIRYAPIAYAISPQKFNDDSYVFFFKHAKHASSVYLILGIIINTENPLSVFLVTLVS
jgi:hypothetical protein